MIYGGSTLGAVHFTLSTQYGFTELCANVYITENDIYWRTGAQQWLKQKMPPHPPSKPFVQWIMFCVFTKVCISPNKLPNFFLVTAHFYCNFSIDSWHERLREKLHWLLGVGEGCGVCCLPVCLSVSRHVKQRWMSVLTAL